MCPLKIVREEWKLVTLSSKEKKKLYFSVSLSIKSFKRKFIFKSPLKRDGKEINHPVIVPNDEKKKKIQETIKSYNTQKGQHNRISNKNMSSTFHHLPSRSNLFPSLKLISFPWYLQARTQWVLFPCRNNRIFVYRVTFLITISCRNSKTAMWSRFCFSGTTRSLAV